MVSIHTTDTTRVPSGLLCAPVLEAARPWAAIFAPSRCDGNATTNKNALTGRLSNPPNRASG